MSFHLPKVISNVFRTYILILTDVVRVKTNEMIYEAVGIKMGHNICAY